MDAWVNAGRPPDRFLVGVATYLSRVLHDTGLCNGTEPKRLRQSAGTADRSDAREAAPDASTHSVCAHPYSGRSPRDLDKAIMVGLDGLLIFDGRRLRLDGTSQGLLGGPWRPLTVAQRLTLQHQLARAEFLARIGLRVSP